MPLDYLHNHPQFADLIRIVAEEKAIDPALVEKDYWIMHCLYGLQQLRLKFELKGGTSLSKGYQIINRFSEDIDITVFREDLGQAVTVAQLEAIFGWTGGRMASLYTRSADRRRLAIEAMHTLANDARTSIPAPKGKVRASERIDE